LARSGKAVWEWCRLNRHASLFDRQRYLSRVIRGHCNDYGLTGNDKQLGRFRRAVMKAWRQWLRRRTRKGLSLGRGLIRYFRTTHCQPLRSFA
ncbi:MAG: hypothetical protein OXD38_10070, partial [Aestuariivita sp.]|nr:hypothetical protein [Aestuariivita sp.]